MTLPTYPEQHTEWLTAMGVARWQSRHEQVVTAPITSEPSSITWSSTLLKARHWLIADANTDLNPATLLTLATMLYAMGLDGQEVAYLQPQATTLEPTTEALATGLKFWPTLQVHHLPLSAFDVNNPIPEHISAIVLGAAPAAFNTQSALVLPSLNYLTHNATAKQQAWALFKSNSQTH
jgi:hypothetical protein